MLAHRAVNTDMVAVERFEVSILLLMEAHQDCHDLAQAQPIGGPAESFT
jgi:hypothetical protein